MEAKDILNEVTENVTKNMEATLEAKASNESVEALKNEIGELAKSSEISEVKSNQETLQKEMDNLKDTISKGSATFGIAKKRSEFEERFAKAASDFKSRGKAEMEVKTFVPGTSTSTLVPSAYATENMIFHDPNYKTQLRDVLANRTESGGSIIWNRETAQTDAAAPKAFGVAQPQTSKTVTRQESTFRTLTNFYTMPEEYFNDISNFESYISGRLMGDLMDLESRQILNGDNTGVNYNGLNTLGTDINTDTELGDWANSIDSANRHDAIVSLASILEQNDFSADCVVLNPFDYYQLALIKASTGEYVLQQAASPSGMIKTYLMGGIEVVKHNAQAANTFTIFDKKAVEYVMRDAVALEFDRNANDFQTNSISVRAQVRGNLADWLPQGVYTANFTGTDGIVTLLETP